MAITTLSGAKAGMTQPGLIAKNVVLTSPGGQFSSLWNITGRPAQGSVNGTLNGVVLTSASGIINGQIPYVHPASGNAYLGKFEASSSATESVWLLDRIWHNGGITITLTSSQAITSPTFPARDINGSTDGEGVFLGLEVAASTGSGTPTITVGYTNSAGTGSRTGTNIEATITSSPAGRLYPIGLQTGDTGVRSVQSIQLSASWTSGTINLIAFRLLAILPIRQINKTFSIDALTGGMPETFSGTVPALYKIQTNNGNTSLSGAATFTNG